MHIGLREGLHHLRQQVRHTGLSKCLRTSSSAFKLVVATAFSSSLRSW
jgi:hypothetical protein